MAEGHASGSALKGKGKSRKRMEALAEEEEEDGEKEGGFRRKDSTSTRRREDYSDESRRPSAGTEEERRPRGKVPPPIPSLKAGDETVSGAAEALVDEISTALREWYSVS